MSDDNPWDEDPTPAFDREQARLQLTTAAPRGGRLFVGPADNATPFDLPEQMDQALDCAAGVVAKELGCFFTPGLVKPDATERKIEFAQESWLVWADVDKGWGDAQQANYDKLRAGCGTAVFRNQSSAGKYHVYVQLNQPLGPDATRALNLRMIAAFNGDSAPQHPVAWMRLAGTVHTKEADNFQQVGFVDFPNGDSVTPTRLSDVLTSIKPIVAKKERKPVERGNGVSSLSETLRSMPRSDGEGRTAWYMSQCGIEKERALNRAEYDDRMIFFAEQMDEDFDPVNAQRMRDNAWQTRRRDIDAEDAEVARLAPAYEPSAPTREEEEVTPLKGEDTDRERRIAELIERAEIREEAERRIHAAAAPTHDEPAIPMSEFVTMTFPDRQWVMPGILRKGERLIITGAEGGGKSTLMRQIAVALGVGIDPFSHADHGFSHGQRVLVIDLENPDNIIQKSFNRMLAAKGLDLSKISIVRRDVGIDLTTPHDEIWLSRLIEKHHADVVVIGPIYKMHFGGGKYSRTSEDAVIGLTNAIDRLRSEFHCAFVMEAHSPHGEGGDRAGYRPEGSNLWLKWPEFGIGLKKIEFPEPSDPEGITELIPWKRREWDRFNKLWTPQNEKGIPPWLKHNEAESGWPWKGCNPEGRRNKT